MHNLLRIQLLKNVNSMEQVKVTAAKAAKVQNNDTFGTGNTIEKATRVARYEEWQITMI